MVATLSVSSDGPYTPDMAMQPRPMGNTWGPVFPSWIERAGWLMARSFRGAPGSVAVSRAVVVPSRTMSLTLPKRSFLALVAIGWADGSLQRKEAEGLVRAAK